MHFKSATSFVFFPPFKQKETWVLVGLFAFSLLFRIVYHLSADMVAPQIRADALNYLVTAKNLVEYGIYSNDLQAPLRSSNLLVPGYPFFLSAIYMLCGDIGAAVVTTFVTQIVIGALSSLLVYWIAKTFLSVKIAFLVALLFSVYPHQVVGSSYLLTETLFTFVFLLSIALILAAMDRASLVHSAAAGVCMAYSIMIKPITLLFGPFLLIVLWIIHSRCNRFLIIFSLCGLISWIPWSLWGHFFAENKASYALAVSVLGSYPDFTHKHKNMRGFPYREDQEYPTMTQSWGNFLAVLQQRFHQDPEKYLSWYLWQKPLSLWQFDIIQGQGGAFIYPVQRSIYDRPGAHSAIYQLTHWFHNALMYIGLATAIVILVIGMTFKTWRNTFAPGTYVCAAVVTYITLVHIPMATLPRFSIPFQPFALMLTALALNTLFNRVRKGIKFGDKGNLNGAVDVHRTLTIQSGS